MILQTRTNIGVYRREVVRDRPFGYWPGWEKSGTQATDQAGANPGTYTGGCVIGQGGAVTGDPSTSVKFDGSTGFIAATCQLLTKTSPFSVECWFKSTGNAFGVLVAKWNVFVTSGWRLDLRGDTTGVLDFLLLSFDGNAGRQIVTTTAGWNNGAWHHCIGTYTGSNTAAGLNIYMDGKLQPSSVLSNTDPGTLADSSFRIGAQQVSSGAGAGNPLNGSMAHIAMYNYALSAGRILAHYRAAKGLMPVARVA